MEQWDSQYQWFYNTPTEKQWRRIGAKRRAGVAVPLFSLYSNESIGIGELPDLKLLIDWCEKTGLTIIQLLPLNDVGFQFTPYDAKSSFALEPMYLSLNQLREVPISNFTDQLKVLHKKYPCGNKTRVNYTIKTAKLAFLWDVFSSSKWKQSEKFKAFQTANTYWLDDYALFTVIKSVYEQKAWWEWPELFKNKEYSTCQTFVQSHFEQIAFQKWLQWQLYEQLAAVKNYSQNKNILLMGDLPFLVSKDSADVWAKQNYFKLHLSAGAPPDMYYADGQRWGMPPYHWNAIATDGYEYLIKKFKYSEHFYDLFRIDHFVGMFRIWTIPLDSPEQEGGKRGYFDPYHEGEWEEHGKRLLDVMIANTYMLPCAEDLGTVPDCSYKVIREYGVVGMDIQRWQRDWGKTNDFKASDTYRLNSIAAVSTHDAHDLRGWWECEAGTVDEMIFRKKCAETGLDSQWLIPHLFDSQCSLPGRLRWKIEIRTYEQFIGILQRAPEQVGGLLGLFRETIDERDKFWSHIECTGTLSNTFSSEMAKKTLEKINRSVSIFSIQLLQDWFALGDVLSHLNAGAARINQPGTMNDTNWSVVMPLALNDMLNLELNKDIHTLCRITGRLVYPEGNK